MHSTNGLARYAAIMFIGCFLCGCTAIPGVSRSLSFNVQGFGAAGDGQTLDTVAFQHAIEAARQAGGATVVVPKGTYLIAPIDLCSNLTLQLMSGAYIKLADDPEEYAVIDSRHDGLMQPARRAGLLADGCSNLSIVGDGVIDGLGAIWWAQVRTPPRVGSTQPGADPRAHRPAILQLRNCSNVKIEGVRFANPPRSAIHVLFSERVTLRNAAFDAPEGSDTTGVEVDSSRAVRIEDCRLAMGSRGVSIEAGRRDPSPRAARASEDVTIRGCRFMQSTTAVAIGPNIAGGVLKVRVLESSIEHTESGVQIQSSPDRTGVIQSIRLADLSLTHVARPFVISLQGKSLADAIGADGLPIIRDIQVSRLTATDATRAGIIEGLEASPIQLLRFDTLNLSANYGISCSRAADVTFEDVQIATDFGPAILRTDTTNLKIDNWVEATRQAPPASQPASTAPSRR